MIFPGEIVAIMAGQIPKPMRKRFAGAALGAFAAFTTAALLVLFVGKPIGGVAPRELALGLAVAAGSVILLAAQVVTSFENVARTVKIEAVEQRVREHPEKPQLAWDLARTKLESYLDRNLSQVRDIFWLTLVVMIAGFCLILYGLEKSFDSQQNFQVSIVASASGVLISFIGGSFLLIYKSILAQSKEYVSVLERINAVGMAVQVLASMSDESSAVRDKSTAELSKQLLAMYATHSPAPEPRRRKHLPIE